MKMFYSNASAKEEIGKLETQVSELKTALETSEATNKDQAEKITKLESDLVAMTTERDEAAKAVEESESKIITLETTVKESGDKLATFDADVEKAAAARFAGLGGNPLPESGKDDNGKPDIAGLTGLAKATAIHKAQASKK
jgi:hypothetical protein